MLPCARNAIRLHSNIFVPAFASDESMDERELGLCVARLQIDGDDISLARVACLGAGWHEAEAEEGARAWRWTMRAAWLPSGARVVLVDLGGQGVYWREPADNRAALFG